METISDTVAGTEEAVSQLAALCLNDRYPNELYRELIAQFHEGEPETVALAIRLISNEIPEAQEKLRRYVISALSVIDDEDNPEGTFFGKSLRYDLLIAWHVANMERITNTMDGGEDTQMNAIWWKNLLVMDENVDRTNDEDYWRGFTILSICATCTRDEADKPRATAFIRWAGTHPDPERVVVISRERDTIDVDTLRTIMEKQEQTAPALDEGVL